MYVTSRRRFVPHLWVATQWAFSLKMSKVSGGPGPPIDSNHSQKPAGYASAVRPSELSALRLAMWRPGPQVSCSRSADRKPTKTASADSRTACCA